MQEIKNLSISDLGAFRKDSKDIQIRPKGGLTPESRENLEKSNKLKALEGFESMLLNQVFKSMWSSLDKSNLFGDDTGEGRLYQDLMLQAVSDETARGSGCGIKAYLQRDLERLDGSKNLKKG